MKITSYYSENNTYESRYFFSWEIYSCHVSKYYQYDEETETETEIIDTEITITLKSGEGFTIYKRRIGEQQFNDLINLIERTFKDENNG